MYRKSLTKNQEAQYDKVCEQIRGRFGSFETIARQAFVLAGEEITGNTVRVWFQERRISTDFCVVLYEMMDRTFSLCDLMPWMLQYFVEYANARE